MPPPTHLYRTVIRAQSSRGSVPQSPGLYLGVTRPTLSVSIPLDG